jgi:hypothetical protein
MRFETKTPDGHNIIYPQQYVDYIMSIRERLPAGVRAIVSSKFYFDPSDHRCPHDSWVERLTLSEPSSGDRSQFRELSLSIRLLGAYHDGYIDFSYVRLKRYFLDGSQLGSIRSAGTAHSDWLTDEFILLDDGLVSHEIRFRSGAVWTIVSEDVVFIPGHLSKRRRL